MAFHQFQHQPAYPNYGYCDSYFVENHDDDDGIYARAAADRERQRDANKQTQRALAEKISRITAEDYQEDVLNHMERMEMETMPDIASIEIQTEIQWFMRPYLLDFLLEAHHAFQLLPETLHLAVNLLDRYCSRRVVYKRHYQLVGCASLLIAAKYGDKKERVPTIRELKSMCCSLYDDDMFTQMEWHVLQTLNWVIGHPTVTGFLQIALTEGYVDAELEHMAWYISELALYHKEFISVRPSIMARSSLALARCILNRPQARIEQWSSAYEASVILNIFNYLSQPSHALSRKYASPQLSSCSTTAAYFLKYQADLAAQAQRAAATVQTPVNDIPTMEITQAPEPNNPYLTPSTPQKVGSFQVPADVITPPITPDKDYHSSHYGNQTMVPRLPCTTTPPPSADHHMLFAPSNVPAQPQFLP